MSPRKRTQQRKRKQRSSPKRDALVNGCFSAPRVGIMRIERRRLLGREAVVVVMENNTEYVIGSHLAQWVRRDPFNLYRSLRNRRIALQPASKEQLRLLLEKHCLKGSVRSATFVPLEEALDYCAEKEHMRFLVRKTNREEGFTRFFVETPERNTGNASEWVGSDSAESVNRSRDLACGLEERLCGGGCVVGGDDCVVDAGFLEPSEARVVEKGRSALRISKRSAFSRFVGKGGRGGRLEAENLVLRFMRFPARGFTFADAAFALCEMSRVNGFQGSAVGSGPPKNAACEDGVALHDSGAGKTAAADLLCLAVEEEYAQPCLLSEAGMAPPSRNSPGPPSCSYSSPRFILPRGALLGKSQQNPWFLSASTLRTT